MGLFDDMLKSDETIFKEHVALDYDYMPKLVPFREMEQKRIALKIKPLFMDRNGENAIVTGKPGIGKTIAVRHLLRELEEEESAEDIDLFYINCWKKNSSYKVILEMCNLMDYKFVHNKKTDELFEVVKNNVNRRKAVFVFDEIDKADDLDFLYMILEEIYKKSIILITNYKDWIVNMDSRIKSRLLPEIIEFRPYSLEETREILKQRIGYAFYDNVVSDEIISMVAHKTYELKDMRIGLMLLREAGNIAENNSRKKIIKEDVERALLKLDDFSKKKPEELNEDEQLVLSICKENAGKKIGELYDIYQSKGGKGTYKTFQRRIEKLSKNDYIKTKKIMGGSEGTTTIIDKGIKKLDDFS